LKIKKSHPDFKQLNEQTSNDIDIKLFEYDKRFEIYDQDFILYDYKNPLNFSKNFENYFDLVIADPPFLSSECHIKTGMTIRKVGTENLKLIICTGAVMEELLAASLKVKLNSFIPKHERNLANEFKCYSNYETYFLNNKVY
jgi:EEF1A lysine methyltransferase 1